MANYRSLLDGKEREAILGPWLLSHEDETPTPPAPEIVCVPVNEVGWNLDEC